MRLIDLPAGVGAVEMRWGYVTNNVANVSVFTKGMQIVRRPGALLTCSIIFKSHNEKTAALLRAFFYALEGSGNYTKIWDWTKERPAGSLHGAPTVNGAAQSGYTFNIANCPNGTELKAGDSIGIGGRLYFVFKDCEASPSGQMSVPLCQPIYVPPNDGMLVEWDRPSCTMICTTQNLELSHQSAGRFSECALDFLEIRL
jgi:hypothetical protein